MRGGRTLAESCRPTDPILDLYSSLSRPTSLQRLTRRLNRFIASAPRNCTSHRRPQARSCRRETRLLRVASVHVAIRIVTHHQSVDQQVTLDRSDRTAHTFIIDRQESDSRQQQQACIESVEP